MKILMRIIVTSIIAFALAYILKGVHIATFWSAIILAIVLSLLNAFVKPFLVLLTLPITIFSLGLFLLVINALIILLADKLMDGFSVDGFWNALLFSLLLSILSSLLYTEKRNSD
ncbi:MAG TPA: phage holin family protein [Flavitalea sp.]|nr:phage holin family protein [Flavitalea sp.]